MFLYTQKTSKLKGYKNKKSFKYRKKKEGRVQAILT